MNLSKLLQFVLWGILLLATRPLLADDGLLKPIPAGQKHDSDFVASPGPGDLVPLVQNVLDPRVLNVGAMLGSLQWEALDAYYGTALLYRATPTHLYYITPSHEIPSDKKKLKGLHLLGGEGNGKPKPAKLFASAPGEDLALLAVERGPEDDDSAEEINAWIAEAMQRDLGNKKWRVGILGVPGFNPDLFHMFKTGTWKEEAQALETWKTGYSFPNFSMNAIPTPSAEVKRRSDCPPVFQRSCYHVPLRSWGFSGGVMLVSPEELIFRKVKEFSFKRLAEESILTGLSNLAVAFSYPKVAGIVTHFSPLSETTYVIPIADAIKTADRLFAEGQKAETAHANAPREITDVTGTFSMVSNGKLDILKGPWAGNTVEAVKGIQAAKEGGGESSGGGGESSGGGGESSGGGGESSGGGGSGPEVFSGHYFLLGRDGNIAGLANYNDLVEHLDHPELWHERRNPIGQILAMSPHFKGVDALLRFHPGVKLTYGEVLQTEVFHSYGGQPIVNLQSFVEAYINDQSKLLNHDSPGELPQFLMLPNADAYGLYSGTTVNKHRDFLTLSPKLKTEEISQAGVNFTEMLMQLALIRVNGEVGGKKLDVIASRVDFQNGGSISRAGVSRHAGLVRVKAVIPRLGMVDIAFRDQFVREGSTFYRFNGPVIIMRTPGEANTIVGHGVAVIQYLPMEKHWELKFIYGHQGKPFQKLLTRKPLACIDVLNEISLEAISFPLIEQANDPLIALTSNEEKTIFGTELPSVFVAPPTPIGTGKDLVSKKEQDEADLALAADIFNSMFEQLSEKLSGTPTEKAAEDQLKILATDKRLRGLEKLAGIQAPPLLRYSLEQQTKTIENRIKILEEALEDIETLNKAKAAAEVANQVIEKPKQ